MHSLRFVKRYSVGLVTLIVVFLAVQYVVVKLRPPGSMSVIEAQAMDMSQSGTPLGAMPVATETVVMHRFAPTVTYTGSVVALNDMEVTSRVTGVVVSLPVYPGDRVRTGQVLARLDSAELASRAKEAEAARRAAQHDFRSAREERNQAIARKKVAEAKTAGLQNGLRDAQAQLAAAQALREQAAREQEAAQAGVADAEAGVLGAQADRDYWTAEFDRQEKLYRAKAVSREEYDREKAQLQQAQAKLAQAQAAAREKRAMMAATESKIRQAEAGIAGARAKLEQVRSDIQGARAEVAAADAGIDLAQHHTAHLDAIIQQAAAQAQTATIVRGYTEIRAAGEGVVTERLVSPGTLVQPGTILLRIKSLDRVRLQANVAESDLGSLAVGSAVTVTSPRNPRLRLQTRVTSLFSAANPQTRTVIIEALTPNPGGRLLPGQYLVMEIATAIPRSAITVPLEAIRRDGDQRPFVWTTVARQEGKPVYTCVMHPEVRSDTPGKCPKCGMDLEPVNKGGKQAAHRVEVALGPSDGRRVVVERGLREGEEVITRGYEYLNEGDPVTPTEWGQGGPKRLPEPSGEKPVMPGMNHSAPVPARDKGMSGMDHSKMGHGGGGGTSGMGER